MIHLGKIIKAEVEKRQLSVKLFAGLINKKEDEVVRLFESPHVKLDLLLHLSVTLHTDLLRFFYEIEPFKTFREKELRPMLEQKRLLEVEQRELKSKLESILKPNLQGE